MLKVGGNVSFQTVASSNSSCRTCRPGTFASGMDRPVLIRQLIFCPGDRRAEWIVFPGAPDSRAHWFTGLDATFRREFLLTSQPGTARLNVRAMRRAESEDQWHFSQLSAEDQLEEDLER